MSPRRRGYPVVYLVWAPGIKPKRYVYKVAAMRYCERLKRERGAAFITEWQQDVLPGMEAFA